MSDELIDIYDSDRNHIGTAMKSEAHQNGLWHTVFHCWIAQKGEDHRNKVWLQLRGSHKQLSSNLLCVSSSGHLQAGETPQDGIREIEEEIGLKVDFRKLQKLFTNKESFKRGDIFNQEFEEIYLLKTDKLLEDLVMQPEEVDGVYEANIDDLTDLINGDRETIDVRGYRRNDDNNYSQEKLIINVNNLVPHGKKYYLKVLTMVNEILNTQLNVKLFRSLNTL